MSNTQILKDLAREYTRNSLAQSASFSQLSPDEQREIYRHVYQQQYRELSERAPTNGSKAMTARAFAENNASSMVDPNRHYSKRIDQAGELAGDFMEQVDFPGFVQDLLKAVFDANLRVTLEQMAAYQNLLKSATESVAKFVNAIDDTAAFGYLAENNSDEFNLGFADEPDENGQKRTILTDKSGEPVDIGDNQVKAKIMEAKIAMAREQRALLREVILMGVSRLVVEKGNVKASVVFDMKVKEQVQTSDKAGIQDVTSSGTSVSHQTGIIGRILGGGVDGGYTRSRRRTQISVSSAKGESNTDFAAKVAGSVDITFKSDYFKLDNFAQMYGPNTAGIGVPQGPGAPGAAAPPALAPGAAPVAPAAPRV
jgi:hypothetical protein